MYMYTYEPIDRDQVLLEGLRSQIKTWTSAHLIDPARVEIVIKTDTDPCPHYRADIRVQYSEAWLAFFLLRSTDCPLPKVSNRGGKDTDLKITIHCRWDENLLLTPDFYTELRALLAGGISVFKPIIEE